MSDEEFEKRCDEALDRGLFYDVYLCRQMRKFEKREKMWSRIRTGAVVVALAFLLVVCALHI